jgi:hypothetical protein
MFDHFVSGYFVDHAFHYRFYPGIVERHTGYETVGAEFISAVNYIYFRRELREKESFLHCSVASADYRHRDALVKRPVAYGAKTDATPRKTFLAFASDSRECRTGSYYYGGGGYRPFVGDDNFIPRGIVRAERQDAALPEFRGEGLRVFAHNVSQLHPAYAGESGVIFNFGGRIYHAARKTRLQNQYVQPRTAGVYRRGKSRGPGAYYRKLAVFHEIASRNRICPSIADLNILNTLIIIAVNPMTSVKFRVFMIRV